MEMDGAGVEGRLAEQEVRNNLGRYGDVVVV